MTAGADAITGRFLLTKMDLVVAAGTIGQAYKVSDTDGNIIGEGVVEAATQVIDVLRGMEPKWVDGIVWTTAPAAGSPYLLIGFK